MTKKLLRISALCFALLSCLFVLSTQNAEASQKTAKVKLEDWISICTWVDFDFWTADVQWIDQTKTKTWQINCAFKKSTWEKVTYTLNDLVNQDNSTYKITAPNVQLQAETSNTTAWNLVAGSEQDSYVAFPVAGSDGSIKVYKRTYDKLWTMTQVIDLKLTIPAGTPAWTYSGAITVLVQPGL